MALYTKIKFEIQTKNGLEGLTMNGVGEFKIEKGFFRMTDFKEGEPRVVAFNIDRIASFELYDD